MAYSSLRLRYLSTLQSRFEIMQGLSKKRPCFSVCYSVFRLLSALVMHRATAVPTFVLISGKMSSFIPFSFYTCECNHLLSLKLSVLCYMFIQHLNVTDLPTDCLATHSVTLWFLP